jgi:nucleotide-binding universal stress UspA family protein
VQKVDTKLILDLERDCRVKVTTMVECGDPRDIIDAEIEKSRIDLVVVGREERKGLSKFIKSFNSLPKHLARKCSVPVIIIPSQNT